MQLRHVLAVVDFSTDAGINAAWRAAHVAWAHGAELCLLTAVELPDARPASRVGATAPPARARADLLHLAAGIREALKLHPAVIVGVGSEGQDTLHACAGRADLVVLSGPCKPALRLAAGEGVPVLLARLAQGRSPRSAMVLHEPGIAPLPSLLGAAQWLCRPDGIHALRLLDRRLARHLQAADQPVPTIQAVSRIAHHRAQEGLEAELLRAGLRRDQGTVRAGTSAARLVQEQARRGASLLVVGKRRQPPWLELLWPGLARQIAELASCDVLIVPERLPSAKDARWTLREGRHGPVVSEEA